MLALLDSPLCVLPQLPGLIPSATQKNLQRSAVDVPDSATGRKARGGVVFRWEMNLAQRLGSPDQFPPLAQFARQGFAGEGVVGQQRKHRVEQSRAPRL